MEKFKSVRVFNSVIKIRNGENIGHGFAVIIDPMPTDESDIIQITEDIKAVVMAFNRENGNIKLNVEPSHLMELHEILCGIPFEDTSVSDSEPSTQRHPAIESMIKQLGERMEFFERRE